MDKQENQNLRRERMNTQANRLINQGNSDFSSAISHSRPARKRITLEDLLKTTGIISFVADCIAIFVYMQQLLSGQNLVASSDRFMGLAIVIVLAFIMSLSLIRFSNKNSDSLFSLFGMIYAVYGAFFMCITSYYSIYNLATEFSQIAGYYFLAIVIAAFCYIVMIFADMNMKWASVPYVLAGIFHIGLVIIKASSYESIPWVSHISLVLVLFIIAALLGTERFVKNFTERGK